MIRVIAVLGVGLATLAVVFGLNWRLHQAEQFHEQSARISIHKLRVHTFELRQMVESQPEKSTVLAVTAAAVDRALDAELHAKQLDPTKPQSRAVKMSLLRSANLLHGELAEAGEHVRDAASAGLERQIDELALLTRRLERAVGPQLAK